MSVQMEFISLKIKKVQYIIRLKMDKNDLKIEFRAVPCISSEGEVLFRSLQYRLSPNQNLYSITIFISLGVNYITITLICIIYIIISLL